MDIQEVWDRLRAVRELSFVALSNATAETGWCGNGQGSVSVEIPAESIMLFHEKGTWITEAGRSIGFTNLYRWTHVSEDRRLRLEHLRFGPHQPVYLFDLVSTDERTFTSIEPHLCRDDQYAARMDVETTAIRLVWTVVGPHKDERISYTYQ